VLIAGGDGKGADFSELRSVVSGRVRCLVVLGRDGQRLIDELGSEVDAVKAGDMNEAVKAAAGIAQPGDRVLLSPACSSLDQYTSYEARGDAFIQAVEAL